MKRSSNLFIHNIGTSNRRAYRSVSRISIRWAITVVSTSFSDFTNSCLRIASSDGTSTTRTSDCGVSASSRAKMAGINGANISVITILWSHGASSSCIARCNGTKILCNTFSGVNTSRCRIETVNSARILIVTIRNHNFTFISSRIALVSCTGSWRNLAKNWIVNTTSLDIAMSGGTSRSSSAHFCCRNDSFYFIASVSDTLVDCLSCDHLSSSISVDAFSRKRIARISGASVLIVADDRIMNANTSIRAAGICSACIFVITVGWSTCAFSGLSVTSIGSAFVSIITKNLSNNAFSCYFIALGWETAVGALANSWGKDTSTGWIARIVCANVVIVTENRSFN